MLTNEKYNIYKNRYISRLSIVPCLAILHNNSPSLKVFKKKVSLLNISFRIRRLLNHGGFKPFLRGGYLKYRKISRTNAGIFYHVSPECHFMNTLINLHTLNCSSFSSSRVPTIDVQDCNTDS